MFGIRQNLKTAIRKGNLERVKEILAGDPGALTRRHKYKGVPGNILEMAAAYNQPAIINFLVTDMGVKVNTTLVESWTALHTAAHYKSLQAVEALLALGADTSLRNNRSKTPYDLCKDGGIKNILRAASEEQQQQRVRVVQEKEQQRLEAERIASAARAEGVWASNAPGEITFERELPGRQLLTNAFNLSTGRLVTTTKDLRDGGLAQTIEYKNDSNKKMFDQASAKLAELRSGAPVNPAAAPAPRRLVPKPDFSSIINTGL